VDPLLLGAGGLALLLLTRKRPEVTAAPPPETPALPPPEKPVTQQILETVTAAAGLVTTLAPVVAPILPVLGSAATAVAGAIGPALAAASTVIVSTLAVGGLVGGIAVVLYAVKLMFDPRFLGFSDEQRDKAINSFVQARQAVFAATRATLAERIPASGDPVADGRRLDLLAASFADGFARTADRQALDVIRKSPERVVNSVGVKSTDLDYMRNVQGAFVGFERVWDVSQAGSSLPFLEIAREGDAHTRDGAVLFHSDPRFTGDAHAVEEPAFRTLSEQYLDKHGVGARTVRKSIGLNYRAADTRLGLVYALVSEHFWDSDDGRTAYQLGAAAAWGQSYGAALLEASKNGVPLKEAIAKGQAVGLIHPAANETELKLTVVSGQSVTFRWLDIAAKNATFHTQALSPTATVQERAAAAGF
jgi:hypothetical protein